MNSFLNCIKLIREDCLRKSRKNWMRYLHLLLRRKWSPRKNWASRKNKTINLSAGNEISIADWRSWSGLINSIRPNYKNKKKDKINLPRNYKYWPKSIKVTNQNCSIYSNNTRRLNNRNNSCRISTYKWK